jgi:hypothetical protein
MLRIVKEVMYLFCMVLAVLVVLVLALLATMAVSVAVGLVARAVWYLLTEIVT